MEWQATGGEAQEQLKTRVLVVDDHDLFRVGLKLLLEQHGFEVAAAMSAETALRRLESFDADVVVMDVHMPRVSGIEATRQVLAQAPNAVVVMLSGSYEEAAVVECLLVGACGYLLKDGDLPGIVAGIRAASGGESPITPRVAASLVHRLRSTAPVQRQASETHLALSLRELEVLDLLAQGWDNAEIAQHLHLSSSTVKNHVSRVLEKLGARNRVQAAVYAAHEGLTAQPLRAAA